MVMARDSSATIFRRNFGAPLGKEKREKYVARNRNKYDANILERISIAKVKTNDENFEECWPDIKGKQANNLLHSSGATFYRTGQAAGMSIKVETLCSADASATNALIPMVRWANSETGVNTAARISVSNPGNITVKP